MGFSVNAFYGSDVVAVFGSEPGSGRGSGGLPEEADRPCAGAVFLRPPDAGAEAGEMERAFGGSAEVEIVESLSVVSVEPGQTALFPTGAKAAYPVLITAYRPGAS